MMATACVRLSQSIAGTLSLLNRPLFFPFTNSSCGHSPGRHVHSLFSSLDCFPCSKPSVEHHWFPPRRLQRRIERSALSGGDNGGSAFLSMSEAGDASVAERSLYSESVTRLEESVLVVTPLCERPASHVTCLEDLLQWRRKAEVLAASVGKEFYEADGGPDSCDLLRELEWLLDDAVAACCRRGRKPDSSGRSWEACSWRDVKACLPVETLRSLDRDSSSNESADVSLEFGVFGTLLKERYTDPVAELAAEGACCCDALRDSLANMASDDHDVKEAPVEGSSSTTSDNASRFPTAVGQFDNKTTNAHVLLRASIEELEQQWTQRVRDRRPFQYVVGCTHWRDLILSVQEGVLIPRPETEQMIDLAEAAIAADNSLTDGLWVDLGTGSGALAIALARLLPSTGSIIAIDASTTAVAVARRNVKQYEHLDRVKVVSGSWFSPLENHNGSLAGVLSNPPYIPSENIVGLQAEVGKHEPQSALDGGEDGMNDLRIICQDSARALKSRGFLALETNGGKQAEAVSNLLHNLSTVGDFQTNMPAPCFQNIRIVPDFAGIMRFVVATRC